ncbi:hypothetical protein [Oscillatoria sp. FACHB-1406]|uniref:hypothetical protein n=1 Tax=Oscillatoria sp. FACHB-1406 TaxID=2692846 RepID=UPI001688DECD|nr:hypothetical protein [Oscillatoria sp. FACHB-1406]MBD2578501.1 hypothetical protein [Oscillatoria sp. FACHB-1406]
MRALRGLVAIALGCILLVGCSDRIETGLPSFKPAGNTKIKLSEVAPSLILQQLRAELDRYQPQVAILSPKAGEVLNDTTATVKLQVRDLPVFKNAELQAGPHLSLILDNHPSQALYNPDEPIVFDDLEPGTHTLRAVAVSPWDETFKNEGAFAQTTFHVLTETGSNAPNPAKPLITYSSPQGSYGAEPIPIDFYLSNAPLHVVAAENPDDEIKDWRIRVTVNGQSFIADSWQPIYLKGFQPGKNWVKLELLDEEGNLIDNAFNSTVRSLDYQPNGQDLLAQLTRGDLSLEDTLGIVDPNYIKPVPPPVVEELPPPVIEETPTVEEVPPPVIEETPAVEEVPETTPVEPEIKPSPIETPTVEIVPVPTVIEPKVEVVPVPEIEPSPIETPKVEVIPVPTVIEPKVEIVPVPKIEPSPIETPTVEVPVPIVIEPKVEVVPVPEVEPSPIETPTVEVPVPIVIEPKVEVVPVPEVEPSPIETPTVEVPVPTVIEPKVEIVPVPEVEPSVVEEAPVTEAPAKSKTNRFLDQLKSRFNKFQKLVKEDSE